MSITVNGVEIAESAVHAEMQHHPAPSRERAEHQAAVALVIRELLLQEAGRLGVEGADDDARIAALVAREVETPEADEASCRRYFDANPARFRSADLFEVAHILRMAPPEDAEARARARAEAQALLAELKADPGRFAELAREHSDCPSKMTGGNLGQVSQGQTVPEFEQALFAMQEGELRDEPVETRFGFHLVRLERRIQGAPLPFDAVREQIASFLRDSVQRMALHQYLRILIGRAEITGIELEGADSPLVQ